MNTLLFSFLFLFMLSGLGLTIRLTSGKVKSNFMSCAVVGVLGGVLVGWLGKSPEIDLPPQFGFCVVMLSMLPVLFYSAVHRSRMQERIARSEEVRSFCTDNFERLDGHGDGLITRLDLFDAQERALSASDHAMIKLVERDLYLIGHIIQTNIAISPMSGQVAYLHQYGINRNDLASWPVRVKKLYRDEFGDEPPQASAGKK